MENAPTAPTLLGIESDSPVIAIRHGYGIRWVVQPENFESLVEQVNRYGGPGMWTIRPATAAEIAEHDAA